MAVAARLEKRSAGGRVLLTGEHAVTYGYEGVAVALERQTHARAVALDRGPSCLHVESAGVEVRERDGTDLGRALEAILAEVRAERRLPPVCVRASTTLPLGAGLGSSVALGVAVARALAPGASERVTLARARTWARVLRGEVSEIDATVATRGGCYAFVNGQRPRSLRVPRDMYLCVAHSGSVASTREMGEHVARRILAGGGAAHAVLRRIGDLAGEVRRAMRAGDLDAVGESLNVNQALLGELDVSTPALDLLCELALGAGALGAKLTGPGGGGCVLALTASRRAADDVFWAWAREGFHGYVHAPGNEVAS